MLLYYLTIRWLGINITISTVMLSPFWTENSCINGNKLCLAINIPSSLGVLGSTLCFKHMNHQCKVSITSNDNWFMLVYSEKSSFLSTCIQRPFDVFWMFKFFWEDTMILCLLKDVLTQPLIWFMVLLKTFLSENK